MKAVIHECDARQRRRQPALANRHAGPDAGNVAALARLATALGQLHFGTITLTVHQSHIVQTDITEKHRFEMPAAHKVK